jgi:hypothetical protein
MSSRHQLLDAEIDSLTVRPPGHHHRRLAGHVHPVVVRNIAAIAALGTP